MLNGTYKGCPTCYFAEVFIQFPATDYSSTIEAEYINVYRDINTKWRNVEIDKTEQHKKNMVIRGQTPYLL